MAVQHLRGAAHRPAVLSRARRGDEHLRDCSEKLVHCDASECTCTIGEPLIGTCPADSVSRNDAIMAAKIAECCA